MKSNYKNKLSLGSKLYRLIWNIINFLIFRILITKQLNRLRTIILRIFGAKIGKNSGVYSSVKIWSPKNLIIGENSWIGPNCNVYNVGNVIIGNNVTVSQNTHLCGATHDYKSKNFDLIYGDIKILNDTWVAADSFVFMNVSIGPNSIVGARSAVFKSIPKNSIAGGNPAKVLKKIYK
jgi:putative colanic acid biosynthesis acetyltransferase WcaF